MNRLEKHIPKDWKAIRFDKVFDFLPTLTLSRSDLTSDEDYQGIYNIHYGDIHTTYKFVELNFDKDKSIPKITKDGIDEAKLIFLKSGDIVIADASEDYEGVAACIELSNVGDRKVTAGLHTFAARDKNGFTSDGFRAYLLKHPWVKNELKKLATGSKVYGISKTNIAKLEVVLPPLPEQQKIAAILSKWDELIDTLKQLIAAKEKQKTSLMQKLFTGEVRFPGFEDEWEEVLLGSVLNITSGKTKPIKTESAKSDSYCIPVYGGNGVMGYSDEYLISGKTILIGRVGEYCGSVHFIDEKSWITDNCLFTSYFSELEDVLYFSYLLKFLNLGKLRNKGGQPLISQKPILSLKICKPKLDEQQKIVSVLSTCDEELQLLKDELEAIQLQKKGLMQQLLTGKIRVKIN